jgi:zinc transporter 7
MLMMKKILLLFTALVVIGLCEYTTFAYKNDDVCLEGQVLTKNGKCEIPNQHVWFNSLISTAAISVFGNVGIVIYMFIDDNNHASGSNWALKTMVGFAVGGLLGDVFLHLLPHGASKDAHDITPGLWILTGIFVFFLVEKLVRMWTGEQQNHHGHSHKNEAVNTKEPMENKIRPGAWLNLFADVTHNFVDGMAIAAAFQTSNVLGTSTTIGVLLHEIPHEMGDFAVLLTQGFSKRGAFLCQFLSALGAFAGCLFGLMISKVDSEPTAVLNFTAGGFIYVALVDVLPELLEEPSSFLQLVREIIALCLGVAVMVYVAAMEHADHGSHSHSNAHSSHGHSHAH